MTGTITRVDQNRAEIRGDLDNSTVPALLNEGSVLLQAAAGQWTLDLAAVDKVSSAGVAMLLEWMRQSDAAGISLRIENLPLHMKPIISISDLDPLFEPLLA